MPPIEGKPSAQEMEQTQARPAAKKQTQTDAKKKWMRRI